METQGVSAAATSPAYWAVLLVTLLLVGLSVGVHYEALERLNLWLPRWGWRARPRVLMLILSLIGIHTIEIWIFGLGIFAMVQLPQLGWVSGAAGNYVFDSVYLSAMTFTTVGYVDLAAHGPIRFTLGSEALTGSVLIAWSASFTFLEMQRFWKVDSAHQRTH